MSAQDNVRIASAGGNLSVLIPGFIQLMKLKNTLRWMRGETLITPLCPGYCD